jgi:hypothetical protein
MLFHDSSRGYILNLNKNHGTYYGNGGIIISVFTMRYRLNASEMHRRLCFDPRVLGKARRLDQDCDFDEIL